MEPQKGYTDNRYEGSPLQLYSRYRLDLRSGFKLGVTAEKDAGERFFGDNQKRGFDFYSAYAYFQSPDKRYLFIIGDFHARFGQGVVLNSGNAVAKGAEVLQIKQVSSPLLPSTSSNESHFFRGIGTSISLNKRWKSTLFFSRLPVDALIEENMKGQEEITSMPSTGNHRTASELKKKNQAVRYSTGARISRSGQHFVTGLSAFVTTVNRPLSRHTASGESSLHDRHHQKRIGGDISWQLKNATFFAEYSRDGHFRTAWMGGILISLDHRLSFGLLKRQYERGFSATFTNAFREGTAVANEEGTYCSIEFLFSARTQLTAYYDLFYFPWMKYRTAAPSEGKDGFIQLRQSLGKEMQFIFRFKSERKQVNGQAEKPLPAITTEKTSGFRLELIHQAHSSLRFKSRIEQSFYKAEGMKEEKGILIFQEIKFQKKGSPFAIACRHALFDTDSYQTRIYAYENDVLYAFSIPSYSGRGSRSYLLLKYRFSRHLTCWLRYARTFFNDRFTIGSGEEQITGNSKTELKFQVRLNF